MKWNGNEMYLFVLKRYAEESNKGVFIVGVERESRTRMNTIIDVHVSPFFKRKHCLYRIYLTMMVFFAFATTIAIIFSWSSWSWTRTRTAAARNNRTEFPRNNRHVARNRLTRRTAKIIFEYRSKDLFLQSTHVCWQEMMNIPDFSSSQSIIFTSKKDSNKSIHINVSDPKDGTLVHLWDKLPKSHKDYSNQVWKIDGDKIVIAKASTLGMTFPTDTMPPNGTAVTMGVVATAKTFSFVEQTSDGYGIICST